jgi:hypothetical protein
MLPRIIAHNKIASMTTKENDAANAATWRALNHLAQNPDCNAGRRHALRRIGRSLVALTAATSGQLPTSFAADTVGEQSGHADEPVMLSAARLDELASTFFPLFNEGKILPDSSIGKHRARVDVALRRITTFTKIPETGERVEVSGLLATPVGAQGALPIVSWQHGTILSFDQVPSRLMRLGEKNYTVRDNVDSIETLFILHRLASQGFAVIAADYLGKGAYRHGRAEAYAVKAATVQCCVDVLNAGLAALGAMGIRKSALFLNGWSQGGLNTQWLSLELQRRGMQVDAVAAQSPFTNLADSLRYWCGDLKFASRVDVSYPAPPVWITPCLVILLGSYREYYKLPDLFKTAIRREHLEFAETYWRDYVLNEQVVQKMPAPSEFLVEGFFDRYTANANTEFLRRLASNGTAYSSFGAPTSFYYGLADEALHPDLVRMTVAGGGKRVQGVPVQRANHRATFLASLYGDSDVLSGASTVPAWFASQHS